MYVRLCTYECMLILSFSVSVAATNVTRPYYHSCLDCDKWMSLRVEAIGSLYASCVVFISILMGLDKGKRGTPFPYSLLHK